MTNKHVVEFSPEASELWLRTFNEIEAEIRPGGRFDGAGDHGSKLADNIARVAAQVNFFEGGEVKISLDTLKFAINYCLHCSDEFMRLFVPPPQEQLDGCELNYWFDRIRNSGRRYIRKNYVRQSCLNKLRKNDRLNLALEFLRVNGYVSFDYCGKTHVIDLVPMLPRDLVRMQFEVDDGGDR